MKIVLLLLFSVLASFAADPTEIVVEGDDDHIVVEVRSKGGSQKVDLLRDKPVEVEVTSSKYRLLFPRVQVSSASKSTTTNQAMLIVDTQR